MCSRESAENASLETGVSAPSVFRDISSAIRVIFISNMSFHIIFILNSIITAYNVAGGRKIRLTDTDSSTIAAVRCTEARPSVSHQERSD